MSTNPPQQKRARILNASPKSIVEAARKIHESGLIGLPTETVYGLAGNVFNEAAVARIFSTKERPTFDPLIVHVSPGLVGEMKLASLAELELVDLATLSPLARERAEALMKAFWPGPLTLVLPKNVKVPDLATSGMPTVGIRMPRHPVAQALIDASRTPLAAPSANRFGKISPTEACHVDQELGDRIEIILDGGPCSVGIESSVVAINPTGELTLLRPGGVSQAELERVSGAQVHSPQAQNAQAFAAPGMLESHYAPSKPMTLLSKAIADMSTEELKNEMALGLSSEMGVLLLAGNAANTQMRLAALSQHPVKVLSLSETGSIEEAAHNLFASLRKLDHSEAKIIFSEPCTSVTGLGHGIADRLRRAAARRS